MSRGRLSKEALCLDFSEFRNPFHAKVCDSDLVADWNVRYSLLKGMEHICNKFEW